MTDQNLTVLLYKKGEIQMVDKPIPEPGPGEVQLCMQQVGICGSDVHFWQDGFIGDFVVKKPMILGHEGSGMVSKLGDGVTTLKVGDRVAIEPGVPCRMCKYCKTGRYNLCNDCVFCATPPHDGNLSRYFVHAADFCFKLPDHVSCEEGAMLEPLSVSVHACNRGGVKLGSKVLILGSGPIGLVTLLTSKAMGASVVCITDIDDSRLEIAKTLGATHTVKVTSRDPEVVAKQVEDIMGDKAEITIECSGATPCVQTAIYVTEPGGCVVLVGCCQKVIDLPITAASLREVDIRGNLRYCNCYPTALEMVASGKVDVKPLITHRFSLEDSIKAFVTTLKGEGIKVMIDCTR
ncbi:sorbitol dehydrogenase-like [Mizuhopecten yessoensis]|uniref:Sorbitol dehydrogenase n=1 Tax=Mizuhopecten yessoensis TaxID=6573 RepID=A0A210PWF4_MIZYE|nr:sorbitol dehydrogenase-like [Mizuhopecten yessoensis]OWF40805.1 Sorbitol dehydrogenase [Mizuhopecten yessoensis]